MQRWFSFRYYALYVLTNLALVVAPSAGSAGIKQQEPPPPTSLRFSTYLGGNELEVGSDLALDSNGNVYVVGVTASPDFPTLNPIQNFKGGSVAGSDIFAAKFNSDGELIYSTFLGGSGDETVTAAAVDSLGALYIVGATTSIDFPVKNALHPFKGGPLLNTDGFLVKLDPDGSSIEFATPLGGTGEEGIADVALDAQGNVYLVGGTNSLDFPTSESAFQPEFSKRGFFGLDAFAVKLHPDVNLGYRIGFSTFLGGTGDELGARIGADADGRAYVAGFTNSEDFPLRVPTQPNIAFADTTVSDVFIAVLAQDGSSMDFGTYLGGSNVEQSTGLFVTMAGDIYVSGWTLSTDFPVSENAYQSEFGGGADGFVAHFATKDDSWVLQYASLLGGLGFEQAFGNIAFAGGELLYVSGTTDNEPFPAIVDDFGGGVSDAFLLGLHPISGEIVYSTFIGGSEFDEATGIAANESGLVCLTGTTFSPDLETLRALQTGFGSADDGRGGDAFVTCLGPGGVSVENQQPTPLGNRLFQNYPNPYFNETEIWFELKNAGFVTLRLFDVHGRLVRTLVSSEYQAGRHQVVLDAKDLSNGMYFYRIEMGREYSQMKRMLLIH